MHTEEEARKLWCPMERAGRFLEHGVIAHNEYSACRASDCAMWRWFREEVVYAVTGPTDPKPEGFYYWDSNRKQWWKYTNDSPTKGYCGLGGKP